MLEVGRDAPAGSESASVSHVPRGDKQADATVAERRRAPNNAALARSNAQLAAQVRCCRSRALCCIPRRGHL
jgi:hypothetical protein